ncbi:hypothetical protein C6P41_000458 [Kluyveromyces marxianus]|nr:hypothetical protein C6P41_000458 [Kluyveromyces marxianus]
MPDLQELLDEKVPCVHHEKILNLFQRFLAKSHCDENLLFIKATNGFVSDDGNEPGFREWSEVYHRYIKEESPKECNFPESIRNGLDVAYRERVVPSQERIKQARLHIVSLLQDAYSKFQRQEHLRDCVRELELQCQCECLCEEMELPLHLPLELQRQLRPRTGSLSFEDIVDGGYSDDDAPAEPEPGSEPGPKPESGPQSKPEPKSEPEPQPEPRTLNTKDIDMQNITTPPSGHRSQLTQENIDLVSPMLDKFGDCAIDDDEPEEGEQEGQAVRALTSDDCNSEINVVTPSSEKTGSIGSCSSRSSLSNREHHHHHQNILDRVRKARTMSTPPLLQASSLRAKSPPAVPVPLPAVSTSAPKPTSSSSARSPQDKDKDRQPPQTPKEDTLPHRIKKLHRYSISSSSKTPSTSSSSSLSSHSPTVNSQKLSKLVHRLKFGRRSSSSGDTSGPQSWQS